VRFGVSRALQVELGQHLVDGLHVGWLEGDIGRLGILARARGVG
jgi:hypothetical protein